MYIAVRDALKIAKDWTTFQRELAKSGVSLRKKYRRGSTIVEGLSFVKGKHKFKASEVAKGRKFSFANIDRILNENKSGQSQSPSPVSVTSPKMPPTVAKQEPSVVEKVIDAALNIGESIGGAVGDLFQLGPSVNPEEEDFARKMRRLNKKSKRKGPKL